MYVLVTSDSIYNKYGSLPSRKEDDLVILPPNSVRSVVNLTQTKNTNNSNGSRVVIGVERNTRTRPMGHDSHFAPPDIRTSDLPN